MKNLGEVKKILGMKITWDWDSGRLWLSQENYILKLLEWLNMTEAKSFTTPLTDHFKLSSKQCPYHQKRRRCLEYHMLVWWDHSCMLWSELSLT